MKRWVDFFFNYFFKKCGGEYKIFSKLVSRVVDNTD